MIRIGCVLSIFASFTAMAAAPDLPYDPSLALLSSFAQGCNSFGSFSIQAFSQMQTLKSLADGIRKQDNCAAVSGALDGVVSVGAMLNTNIGTDTNKLNIANLEGEMQQLEMGYHAATDATLQSLYASNIATVQLELASAQASVKDYRKATLLQGAANFVQYGDSLFSALQADQNCLGQSKTGTAVSIASQVISQGAQLLSFPLGLATYAVGRTVNNFVAYLRGLKYQESILRMNDALVTDGVACAIESMAQTYCSARDTAKVIDAQNLITPDQIDADQQSWPGILLLNRDIQAFNAWVQRVVAGAAPSSDFAAQEKSQGDLIPVNLQIADDAFQGFLSTYQSELLGVAATDPKYKTLVRNLISDLIGVISSRVAQISSGISFSVSSSMPKASPFYQKFQYDLNCGPLGFFYTGKYDAIVQPTGQCPPFSDAQVPAFEVVQGYAKQLVADTKPIAQQLANQFLESNGQAVLAQLEQGPPGQESVLQFLDQVKAYLDGLLTNFGAQIPDDTLTTLSELDSIIAAIKKEKASADNVADKLKNLRDLVAPRRRLDFFQKDLETIVKWEIWYRINTKQIADSISAIVELSGKDILDTLAASGVISTLDGFRDIDRAQTLSAENMGEVLALFQQPILERLQRLSDPVHQKVVGKRHFGDLCVAMALVPPEAPQRTKGKDKSGNRGLTDFKKIAAACKGATYDFNYAAKDDQGKPQTKTMTLSFDDINSLSLDQSPDRICKLYDFRRATQRVNLRK